MGGGGIVITNTAAATTREHPMTTILDTSHTSATAIPELLAGNSLAVFIVTGGLALLTFGFVVLPAVWSRHPDRRRAAAAVLKILLTFLRPPKTPRRHNPPFRRRTRQAP